MDANHEEAYQLACMKRGESNLALAYIDIGEENARLREELAAAQDDVAAWKYEADGFRKGRDALSAELIAARTDAKRYRWLRNYDKDLCDDLKNAIADGGANMDAAIDDAIAKEKTE